MAFDLNVPRVSVPQGKRARLLWVLGAALLVLLVGYNSCTTYVKPGEAGVKQIKFGLGKGIEPFVYGTGLHYVGVGETMHRFPVRLQVLELSNSRSEEDLEGHRIAPGVNIQTSEGYAVQLDLTVLYRIADPLKVMQTIGPGRLFEDSAVIPRAQQDLRRALGELDAEDFYRGDKRVQKARAAQQALEAELKDKGIEVVQVLIRRYTYDQRYQQAIEQRKIQDQTVYKNEAEAKSASAAAAKNKIVAEGAAAVQVELARGEAEVKKLEADADLYRRRKAADGDLLVKLAEAQGTELENQALRGAGSENMVGLRMADALRGTRLIVLPTDGEGAMNPLDLKTLLKRFDVKE
ncbi:MAG TPA: SPFH domain-containing protein [Myxococcales bacterium]|nr:SPFH domain-containing protein [Myxococcales bacterium]